MRITPNQILFFASTFPFLVPLIGSTDTQPTFTLVSVFLAILFVGLSLVAPVRVNRHRLIMAMTIGLVGVAWLCVSVFINAPEAGNVNRQVSFMMFLAAVIAGIVNNGIFTRRRVIGALLVYGIFTVIFFVTRGAVESVIIRSRSEDGLLQLFLSGRGASTLSPEPSFFAFQVFTLFLFARLVIWEGLSPGWRHFVQLASIGLLGASLGGYGMVYAMMVAFLAGARYLVLLVIGAAAAVVLFNAESLRVLVLLSSLLSSIYGGQFGIDDVSILVRLTSFSHYLATFASKPIFGDAFAQYGSGGLIGLLAGLGFFGLAILGLALAAVLLLVSGIRLKLVLLAWLLLQTISGPIGLPFVGLMIGHLISRTMDVRGDGSRTPAAGPATAGVDQKGRGWK